VLAGGVVAGGSDLPHPASTVSAQSSNGKRERARTLRLRNKERQELDMKDPSDPIVARIISGAV